MNRIVSKDRDGNPLLKNGKPTHRIEYIGADGKRHQAYRPTVGEAEELLAKEILASLQPTVSDLPTTMTLQTYAPRWLEQVAAHLKPRSMACYGAALRVHLLPEFGATRVRDLQRGKVKAFLAKKLSGGMKPNSVRLLHATLRALLNAAVDDGLIVANVTDKLGRSLKFATNTKVRQERIKAMDRAQRDAFLATAARIEPWYAPLWEVQVLSGLRPGEVYALEEDDLDLEAQTARIDRTLADDGRSVGTPKGNRGRTVDLSARAVQVLRTHGTTRKTSKLKYGWTEMPEAFFCSEAGTHPDPRNVRDAFAGVVKAAKLPHFTPHALRHTFASLLLVAGIDVFYVSRMLGHSSISETVDTYGRWLPANRKGALDVLDTPAAGSSL